MKNAIAISNVAHQLTETAKRVESLCLDTQQAEQGNYGVADIYESMIFNELEHAQLLTLKLTELISAADDREDDDSVGQKVPAENMDEGSVFGAGELTHEKGEQTTDEAATTCVTDTGEKDS